MTFSLLIENAQKKCNSIRDELNESSSDILDHFQVTEYIRLIRCFPQKYRFNRFLSPNFSSLSTASSLLMVKRASLFFKKPLCQPL